MIRRGTAALVGALLASAPLAAWAEPTPLTIRVLSLGGKFIGSGMGGARIVVRDAHTQQILAQGITTGGTGDTKRIMAGGPRNTALADESTAAFRTVVDLAEPTLLEVEAYGPAAQLQSAISARSQRWVLPGHGVATGDGWVVELAGLAVDVTDPPAHVRLAAGEHAVTIRANVALLCGCPIEPGGLWDAARFDVTAQVSRDGGAAVSQPLTYAGRTGLFAASIDAAKPGTYAVTVTAVDRATDAVGIDRTTFIVP
ncbi:hypothetical protein NSE01_22450 [Novosphingobium sediminis]|uniref:Uncharacterized protein n=1 Tax=Novosphingobium sediminis TaxID=707214 RepID=A0A512AL36_9SPHN|nr:hypothetical protein [Novosphingobium sediminis]GEO00413.1 hypothetical protein NSE01_22450 [Novosphingobium sediminis]